MFIAAILIFSSFSAASAAETGEGLKFIPAGKTETRIVYIDDTAEIYSGAVDPESIEPSGIAEKISSYELLFDGESVLEVTLNDIHSIDTDALAANSVQTTNGYYAAEFELTGQNKSAYITGLTPGNISLIQNKLIKSYATEELLYIEDFDFIDVEKTMEPDVDTNLCWAGSCSNMLAYSGWGERGGYADTDDIFEAYIDAFKDDGFLIDAGLKWFFNGITGIFRGFSTLEDFYNSGNFISAVPAEDVVKNYYMDKYTDVDFIRELKSCLKKGCAVGLSIRWGYTDGKDSGGHAITCWGCIENNDYPEDDFRHYESLLVCDSDDDPAEENRRMSPNRFKAIKMSAYSCDKPKYEGIIFTNYSNGVLNEFVTLEPYEAGKYEDNTPGASHDRRNTIDLLSTKAVASTSEARSDECYKIPYGSDAYVYARLSNMSETEFNGDVDVLVTVTDSNGDQVASERWTEKAKLSDYDEINTLGSLRIEKPEAGTYTVTATVDPDRTLTEAFYTNNTSVSTFEVADAGFDISESSIEAQIVSPDDPENETTLEYINIPREIINSKIPPVVYALYNDNGSITEVTLFCEEGEKLPSSAQLEKHLGDRVRFVLSAELDDIGYVTISSEEYELEYNDIVLKATENNTKEFTPIECGQMGFNEGEKAAFTVTNTSKSDTFEGTVYVGISGADMTGGIQTETVSLTLGPGETSQELVFDTFESNNCEGGKASVIALADGTCGEGIEVSNTLFLGRISVAEKESSVVNSPNYVVDRYDGFITLPEAVAYCPDGGTVTFKPYIRDVKSKTGANGEETATVVEIDKDIAIDGGYYCKNGNLCGVLINGLKFDVKPGARLKLRGLKMTGDYNWQSDYGSAVYCRGALRIEDCLFDNISSSIAGGAVYFDGGTAELVNTTFFNDHSLYGGAIAVNKGAKVNMLNCSVLYCNSRAGGIYNINGELNVINSDIMLGDTALGYDHNGNSLTGNRVTRIVNSVFYGGLRGVQNSDFNVSGDVELYGCVYQGIADEVNADDRCATVSSFEEMGDPTDPLIFAGGCYDNDIGVHTIANLRNDFRSRGYTVSAEDGFVVYSDGKNTYQTGIASVFDNAEYSADMFGTQRDRAYGCCCDVTKIGKTIRITKGDVNRDGAVDILDAAAVQMYASDKLELDDEQLGLADVNFDGEVNVLDAGDIQKYAVGKIEQFSEGKG